MNSEVKQMFDEVRTFMPMPMAPGAPARVIWADKELDSLDSTVHFPESILNPTVLQPILVQFFNFYFTGRLEEKVDPHQLIFSCIAMTGDYTSSKNNRLFNDHHFSNSSFYDPIDAAKKIPADFADFSPVSYNLGYVKDQKTVLNIKSTNYLTATEINGQIFAKAIKKRLNQVDANGFSDEFLQLLSLASFLALVSFRACTKDEEQMGRAFNKKLVKAHLHNLAGWSIADSYVPPCQAYVSACVTSLNKSHRYAGIMMAKIVKVWRDAEQLEISPKNVALLQAALLTHTAGNGLGLISFLFGASTVLNASFETLMNSTLTTLSKDSWKLLLHFGSRYLRSEDPCRTFYWARIINDGYFQEFSAKHHPYLTGVFAGIVASVQTFGSVEEAEWFKQTEVTARNGYNFGKAVVQTFRNKPDAGLTPEAAAILKSGEMAIQDHSDQSTSSHNPNLLADLDF